MSIHNNDPSITLAVPQYLEDEMRAKGMLALTWGRALSAAIIWTAANCGDIDAQVEAYKAYHKDHRGSAPARRRGLVLTDTAAATLRLVTHSRGNMSIVIKAMAHFFIHQCPDIARALDDAFEPRAVTALSTLPLIIKFDDDTMAQLASIAEQAGCGVKDVVVHIVRKSLAANLP